MRSGIGDPNVDIMGYTMDSLYIKKSFRLENSNPSVGGKRCRGKEDNSTAFNFQFSKKKRGGPNVSTPPCRDLK